MESLGNDGMRWNGTAAEHLSELISALKMFLPIGCLKVGGF